MTSTTASPARGEHRGKKRFYIFRVSTNEEPRIIQMGEGLIGPENSVLRILKMGGEKTSWPGKSVVRDFRNEKMQGRS